jgi:hypothetical protein
MLGGLGIRQTAFIGLMRKLLKWWQISAAQYLALLASWSSSASATGATITLPTGLGGSSGGAAYRGHCVGQDGKIYGVPHRASGNIMVVDPATNTVTFESFGLSGLGTTGNYLCCVLHPNGKIYAPPLGANHVLIVDTDANTTEKQTWGLTFSGAAQYNTALVGPDNKIYCIGSARDALIIDPVANTAIRTNLSGTMPNISQNYKWGLGAVRSIKNDKLYFGPYSQQSYLVIDTVSQTANTTVFTGDTTIGATSTQGAVNAPNGNLIFGPHNTAAYAIIDPVANTRVRITGTKSIGLVLGADGNAYSTGFQSTNTVFKYDPVANSVSSNSYSQAVSSGTWGGSAASNGKIYFFPDLQTNPLNMTVVDTKGTAVNQPEFEQTVQSAYFNKTQ